MLADFSLADLFWAMLWFFLFMIWIWLLITVFADLFRDHELSGWAKAAWVIFVIIMPFLGILVYLIARGNSMTERNLAAAADQQAQFDEYVQTVASDGGGGTAEELEKLHDLNQKGVLSDEEYQAAKAKTLNS
jgi:hypothetical protein